MILNQNYMYFFEAMGIKSEEKSFFDEYVSIGDGFKYEKGSFKRAFKTLEEAKYRDYVDYKMVFGYARSFVGLRRYK